MKGTRARALHALRGPLVGAAGQSGDGHALAAHGAQDRTSCRGPAGEQVFDLYHDAVTNQWVLDVAHD